MTEFDHKISLPGLGGLYVSDLAYVPDGFTEGKTVSFALSNTNYLHAVVEVYDASGQLTALQVAEGFKFETNVWKTYDYLFKMAAAIRDTGEAITRLDWRELIDPSSAAQSNTTDIKVTVPKDGYIVAGYDSPYAMAIQFIQYAIDLSPFNELMKDRIKSSIFDQLAFGGADLEAFDTFVGDLLASGMERGSTGIFSTDTLKDLVGLVGTFFKENWLGLIPDLIPLEEFIEKTLPEAKLLDKFAATLGGLLTETAITRVQLSNEASTFVFDPYAPSPEAFFYDLVQAASHQDTMGLLNLARDPVEFHTGTGGGDRIPLDLDRNWRVRAGAGDDTVLGGLRNDVIFGEAGADSLVGGDGNDTVDGGPENDTIRGGGGTNLLYGGLGDDDIASGQGQTDPELAGRIYGGGGNDTILVQDSYAVDGGSGDDVVMVTAPARLSVDGGTGNDLVVLQSAAPAVVEGGAGEDTLLGFDGGETLRGGDGYDAINGQGGDDILDGGRGNDTLSGGAGNDDLVGGSGLDLLDGGAGDDHLFDLDSDGGSLLGGDGNDDLWASGGGRAEGGAGNDTIFATPDVGVDGGPGGDRLDLSMSSHGAAVTLGPDVFDATVALGIEALIGTTFDDTLAGSNGDDVLDGEAGRDRLLGGGGNDVLYAGIGDDTVSGGDGEDTLVFTDAELVTPDGQVRGYPVARVGDRYLIAGSQGSVVLSGVERVQFRMADPLRGWVTTNAVAIDSLVQPVGTDGPHPLATTYTATDAGAATRAWSIGTGALAKAELSSSADGRYLVYTKQADVYCFDTASGTETRVTDGTGQARGARISADGNTIVYQVPNPQMGDITVYRAVRNGASFSVSLVGVQGAVNGQTVEWDSVVVPLVSADGRFVVFDSYARDTLAPNAPLERQVRVYDTAANTWGTRLTLDPASKLLALSDNGETLAFSVGSDGGTLYLADTTGSGGAQEIGTYGRGGRVVSAAFAQDGTRLSAVFAPDTADSAWRVKAYDLAAGTAATVFRSDPFAAQLGQTASLGAGGRTLEFSYLAVMGLPENGTTHREYPFSLVDLDLGTIGRISVRDPQGWNSPGTLSADGRWLSYWRLGLDQSGTPVASLRQIDTQLPLLAGTAVDEGAATHTLRLTATLPTPSLTAATYRITTRDGTAKAGSDYVLRDVELVVPKDATTVEVPVTILGDVRPEYDETFEVVLTDAANPSRTVSATVTIRNDDRPVVTLPGRATNIVESSNLAVPIAVATASDYPFRVDVNGIGTVTIAAGETTHTAYFHVDGRPGIYDGGRTEALRLSAPEAAVDDADARNGALAPVLSGSALTVLVREQDDRVSIAQPDLSQPENGVFSATLVREGNPSQERTIWYRIAPATGNTAGPGDLFSHAPDDLTFSYSGYKAVTFAPGETRKTISFKVTDDGQLGEPNETFTLSIEEGNHTPVDPSRFGTSTAVGTIVDDDKTWVGFTDEPASPVEGDEGVTELTFVIRRGGDLSSTTRVDFAATAVSSPAPAIVDATSSITFAPGETAKTVTIKVVNDNLALGETNLVLTLTAPDGVAAGGNTLSGTYWRSTQSATVQDDDEYTVSVHTDATSVREGDTLHVSIVRQVGGYWSRGGLPVSVGYSVQGSGDKPVSAADFGGALPGGTVTFTPDGSGYTQTIEVDIPVGTDALAEGDEELTLSLQDDDHRFRWVSDPIRIRVTDVTDGSQNPGPTTYSVGVSPASAFEGNAGTMPFVFTVSRSGDTSAPVSLPYTVTGSGANPANGGDFLAGVLPAGTVRLDAGQASASVTILVSGDIVPEADETFAFAVSDGAGGAGATATIRNDDGSIPAGSTTSGTPGNDTLSGTAGNDTLSGLGGDDRLSGLAGDDTLDGGSGNDQLFDGAGSDSVDGGPDDDVLGFGGTGGAGSDVDTLNGGAGIDEARHFGNASLAVDMAAGTARDGNGNRAVLIGVERLWSGPGDDSLLGGMGNDDLIGADGNDTISGGGGDDVIRGGRGADVLAGGAGKDRIEFWNSTAGVAVDLQAGTAAGGDADGDAFSGFEDLLGSFDQGDSLAGDSGDNVIIGLGGNDVLRGGDGNDALLGDMMGNSGNDTLDGGAGDDYLDGGSGGDLLTGGSGNDAFRVRANTTITDFTMGDVLLVDGTFTSAALTTTTSGGVTTLAIDRDGNGTTDLTVTLDGSLTTPLAASPTGDGTTAITQAPAAPQTTVSIASTAADRAEGDAGTTPFVFTLSRTGGLSASATLAYTVTGVGANPAASADFGGTMPSGSVSFTAGEAVRTLTIAVTGDTVAEPDETFAVVLDSAGGSVPLGTGSASGLIRNDDSSSGGDGNGGGGDGTTAPTTTTPPTTTTTQTAGGATVQTTVTSGSVAVSITPPAGTTAPVQVSLTGDGSSDPAVSAQVPAGVGLTATGPQNPVGKTQAADTLTSAVTSLGASPTEQATLTGAITSYTQSLAPTAAVTVRTVTPTVTAGTATGNTPIVITGGGTGGEALVIDTRNLPSGTILQIDNVGFVAVVGNAQVSGGAGSQFAVGDNSSQIMVLGADDDTLRGGGGDDFVGSREGNDLIYGDDGFDTVTGGLGNDSLYGNLDPDLLYGNQGADALFGGQGGDTVFGGQDGDALYGNMGGDVVYGNMANDTVFGGQGGDTLFGGQGDDSVAGNLGDDALFGNLGNDTLNGGAGSDTLGGGDGADVFRFNAASEGGDVITDFQSGVDRIAVVSPNFGNLTADTLSASNFALNNPADANDLFVFNTATGTLSYDADGNGAGAAVTIATLNVRTLSHTDILVVPS
ncbi:Calx-beta domain-containing protein [Azospirillum sp.]|uniref:Calx-beta domain-containing protein n=1 Tax=Azospirillum sp. TaxID=34012 RepID=UPI002D6BDE32|nr:Calx-beta domain-containing protein [Azospirillum sp.]HYD70232.1 Calx-beta domain-containing protein [Azospirillum sp.]